MRWGKFLPRPPSMMQVERVQLPKLSSGRHRAPAPLRLFAALFAANSPQPLLLLFSGSLHFCRFFAFCCSARYHPTTMSEAAAADADTTKVNLVSLSSTVSICFCGDFPVRGGRESRVRDLQSTGTESQSEAGGRPRRELWLSAGFAQPCPDRTGPGGAFILSKG